MKSSFMDRITGTDTNFTYSKVLVRQNQWDDKMYLFPFPQEELYMNENLVQNPDW